MSEGWLRRSAEEFWELVGEEEPFPRTLENAVLWTLPLSIKKMRRLRVRGIEGLLESMSMPCLLCAIDRSLRGCLVAHAGRGLIVLDADDPEDEARFSLAHEVAHFWLDYFRPRQKAVAHFGPQILEVLNGIREATLEERVCALLGDVQIGVHTHMMERHADGGSATTSISDAEDRADRLALELLAPAEEVRAMLEEDFLLLADDEEVKSLSAKMLTDKFGLPASIAGPYAAFLNAKWAPEQSIRNWLRLMN